MDKLLENRKKEIHKTWCCEEKPLGNNFTTKIWRKKNHFSYIRRLTTIS